MAKLYFTYSAMGAGKSSLLLQTNWNYRERGMSCLLLTAAVDTRFGTAQIASRIGISAPAETFSPEDNLMTRFLRPARERGDSCVLIDEAQFLTAGQVWHLAEAVDRLDLPVMAFGLRTDFMGNLFEGSAALLAAADNLREHKTICDCGRKATYVLRMDTNANPVFHGAQVEIGGNDRYIPVCRRHWMEAWIDAGRPCANRANRAGDPGDTNAA